MYQLFITIHEFMDFFPCFAFARMADRKPLVNRNRAGCQEFLEFSGFVVHELSTFLPGPGSGGAPGGRLRRLVVTPVKSLRVDVDVQSYIGRREGVTGSVKVEYRF
jgi:hypothetical protein